MGLSWSRRRYDNYPHNPSPLQPRLPSSSSYTSSDPSSSSYSTPHPPPPPPPSYVFAANAPYPPTQYPYSAPPHSYYQYNTTCGYAGGLNYQPPPPNPYYGAAAANQFNGWHGSRPPLPFPPPPPPYVEHHEAKKVKNLVNVHKDTIKLQVDAANPDSHLLSFTLDAMVDGSITIFYFAKEGVDCVFMPQYPDAHMPVRIPFEKGLGQKFCQPSGSGIDLGFYDVDDLLKPSPGEDIFPLVIFAEACSSVSSATQQLPQPPPTKSNTQITQAVIEKKNEGTFQVKVMKQILWVDGVRYELREIYGIGTSAETGFDDTDPGKECVICMSEPKDTAILPCRHMCLCSECAKELRRQTNKCPICRQPIEELIEIKVNKGDE